MTTVCLAIAPFSTTPQIERPKRTPAAGRWALHPSIDKSVLEDAMSHVRCSHSTEQPTGIVFAINCSLVANTSFNPRSFTF